MPVLADHLLNNVKKKLGFFFYDLRCETEKSVSARK